MRAADLGNPCEPDRHLTAKVYDNQATDLLTLTQLISKAGLANLFKLRTSQPSLYCPTRARFPILLRDYCDTVATRRSSIRNLGKY